MREDTTSALPCWVPAPSPSRRPGLLFKLLPAALPLALFAVLPLSSSCSDSSGAQDMTVAADLTQRSCCGYPGDTGNTKGVGRYCTSNTDPACRSSGLPANICSTAEGNPNRPTFFCTMACSGDTDTTTCGENATCTKNSSGLYGCVPQSCLSNLPPGCPL